MGREGRPPPNRARVTRPHSAHGGRESPMGSTADPSGAGKAWFPSLCADIGKYMRRPWDGEPSLGWRAFLKQHASAIWACDFLCVRTVFFQTLYVFFVVDHANREVLHVQTTRHPTAEWASVQIIECCGGIGSHRAFSSTIVTGAMVRSSTDG